VQGVADKSSWLTIVTMQVLHTVCAVPEWFLGLVTAKPLAEAFVACFGLISKHDKQYRKFIINLMIKTINIKHYDSRLLIIKLRQ